MANRDNLSPTNAIWLEIGRYDVARFLSDKQRQGYAAAHVRAMRATLSKIVQATVDWLHLGIEYAYALERDADGCQVFLFCDLHEKATQFGRAQRRTAWTRVGQR